MKYYFKDERRRVGLRRRVKNNEDGTIGTPVYEQDLVMADIGRPVTTSAPMFIMKWD